MPNLELRYLPNQIYMDVILCAKLQLGQHICQPSFKCYQLQLAMIVTVLSINNGFSLHKRYAQVLAILLLTVYSAEYSICFCARSVSLMG